MQPTSPVRLRLVPKVTTTSYETEAKEPPSPIRMQLELLACRARVTEIEAGYEEKLAEIKADAKAQVERLKRSVYNEMQRQIEAIKREAEAQVERGLHQLEVQSETELRILQQLEKRTNLIDAQVMTHQAQKTHRQESTAAVQKAADEIVHLRSLVESLRVENKRLEDDLEASHLSEKTHCQRANEAMAALTRSRRANEEALEELIMLRGNEAQHQKEKDIWIGQISAAEQAIACFRNDMHSLQKEMVDQVVARMEDEIVAARKVAIDDQAETAQKGLKHIQGVIAGAMAEAKNLEKSARYLLQQAREDQAKTQRALVTNVRRMAGLEELRLKDCRELALLEQKLRGNSSL